MKINKYLLIAIVASILFFPLLGQVHLFDWDEINFAECAREMIVTKDYIRAQIDFMPFWEKPPVFIWMQVLAMQVFGIGDYAARFPNALMGVITLLTLFYAGKKIANEKMALMWVAAYAGSWLPHFYFKSGIIDPTFNFFIFLAFFQFHLLQLAPGNRLRHAALSGLFLGMAVLTKGPVAVIVAALSLAVWVLLNRGLKGVKPAHLFIIALVTALPFLAWMGIAVLNYGWTYGSWFLNEFITYQIRLFRTEDADHGGPFIYHFVVLLVGCFPAAAFLFQRSKNTDGDIRVQEFSRLMRVLFWVVLILFSIVKTKIVHYSSLCYFPLTWLAATQMYQLYYKGVTLRKTVRTILLVTGILWAVVLIALPLVGLNKQILVPLIDDPFAVGNLQANVSWHYAECIAGILYLTAIILLIRHFSKNATQAMAGLLVAQLLIIQFTIYHFTPKIEAFSQRAAIDYYQSFAGSDVYIRPLGYKSYANLYYARKQPFAAQQYYDKGAVNEDWLMNGKADKPVVFICKIQDAKQYEQLPQLEKTGEKNGFVFFKRK